MSTTEDVAEKTPEEHVATVQAAVDAAMGDRAQLSVEVRLQALEVAHLIVVGHVEALEKRVAALENRLLEIQDRRTFIVNRTTTSERDRARGVIAAFLTSTTSAVNKAEDGYFMHELYTWFCCDCIEKLQDPPTGILFAKLIRELGVVVRRATINNGGDLMDGQCAFVDVEQAFRMRNAEWHSKIMADPTHYGSAKLTDTHRKTLEIVKAMRNAK